MRGIIPTNSQLTRRKVGTNLCIWMPASQKVLKQAVEDALHLQKEGRKVARFREYVAFGVIFDGLSAGGPREAVKGIEAVDLRRGREGLVRPVKGGYHLGVALPQSQWPHALAPATLRTSMWFIAISVNLSIFDCDNRFALTASFSALSNACDAFKGGSRASRFVSKVAANVPEL